MKIQSVILTLSCILVNCGDKDYKLSPEQLYQRASSAANDNNQIITTTEEIVGLTADVLVDEGISNGRPHGSNDSGRSCTPSVDQSYLIDRSHYDTLLYIGTMTMDYGNGESCADDDYKRKGKIIDDFEYIVNYKNEIFLSKETITFDGFKKDSVEISGIFIIKSATGDPVTIETDKATITYADGKSVVWSGSLDFITVRQNSESVNNSITGSLTGITKRFENFNFTITEPVVYNYHCTGLHSPIPVEGTVIMNINEEKSIVTYGDGACDNIYTLTVGERQTKHEL